MVGSLFLFRIAISEFFLFSGHHIWDKKIGHIRHYDAEELKIKSLIHGFSLIGVQYSGHMLKVLQILLHDILHFKNQKVWWKLEELDSKSGSTICLQLTLFMRKDK